MTDRASVEAAFAKVVESFGGVDILVSNAGAALTGMMAEMPDEILRKSFEINFFAHQNVARAAVAVMKRQKLGGVLLFNVSKQAVNPGPNFGAYGTSKAALLALVRQYALEHGGDGIRVNALNPDRIRSGLLTPKMIASRAEARGLSPSEYMAGNLLARGGDGARRGRGLFGAGADAKDDRRCDDGRWRKCRRDDAVRALRPDGGESACSLRRRRRPIRHSLSEADQ